MKRLRDPTTWHLSDLKRGFTIVERGRGGGGVGGMEGVFRRFHQCIRVGMKGCMPPYPYTVGVTSSTIGITSSWTGDPSVNWIICDVCGYWIRVTGLILVGTFGWIAVNWMCVLLGWICAIACLKLEMTFSLFKSHYNFLFEEICTKELGTMNWLLEMKNDLLSVIEVRIWNEKIELIFNQKYHKRVSLLLSLFTISIKFPFKSINSEIKCVAIFAILIKDEIFVNPILELFLNSICSLNTYINYINAFSSKYQVE